MREGYEFLPRRFRRLGTEVLEARLLLQRTICMVGRDAAVLFYDSSRFQRRGAAPRRARVTLFGRGGVQGLDDQAHLERKAMFMRLMDEDSIDRLVRLFHLHWRDAIPRWQAQAEVELLTAAREVLTAAVCEWAGVPLSGDQVERRSNQLAALVEGAAAVGPRYWRARLARMQTNRWIINVIRHIRAGLSNPAPGTAAHVIAWQHEGGKLLPARVAAVELINVLRPTVAVARFIVFAALALHEHGHRVEQLEPRWDWNDARDLDAFVQEVRRYYPFFPVVAARVRTTFDWRGRRFQEGRRVLLDLYGTNRDPRYWGDPDEFLPERFRGLDRIDPFALIPQGGGDHHRGHRCAGEAITIALMHETLRILTGMMSYRVPEQDLRIHLGRLPARPAEGFIIDDVNFRSPVHSRAGAVWEPF